MGVAAGVGFVGGRLGEEVDVDRGDFVLAVADVGEAVVGDFANDGGFEFPALEEGGDIVDVFAFDDGEHALLGFGEHDVIGRHAGLAAGDLGDVESEAGVAARGALDGAAGESGGAEVLEADEPVAMLGDKFDAGFHEQLFHEGVADLDGGASFFAGFVEFDAGERRAVDPVFASVGADKHVAGCRRPRRWLSDQPVLLACYSDAHGIHEWIAAVVRIVER